MQYRLFLFITAFAVAMAGKAQTSRLYTTQNGLTSSSIYSTYIDSNGIAWVSGVASLDMFDGVEFHNQLVGHKDLLINTVRAVKERNKNQLWLATSNGLILFDTRDNSMKRIPILDDEIKAGASINSFIDYVDKGYLLISTDGQGMIVFNEETCETDKDKTAKLKKLFYNGFCRRIFIDKQKRLWVTDNNHELYNIDFNSKKLLPVRMTAEASEVAARSNIDAIVQLRKSGNILFGTKTGLLVYDSKAQVLRTLNSPFNSPVSTIIERKDGTVLVGTDSRGIWQMHADETLTPYYIYNPNVNLDFAKVRSFCEDADGNLLVGIYQRGVLVLPNHSDNFMYYAVSPTSNKMNASCITSITADKAGNYWIGTDGAGAFMSKGSNLSNAVPVGGLKSPLVQSIVVDKRGTVWLGSYGGGVQCRTDGDFVTPDWLQQFAIEPIMDLAYDQKHDVLYVGTNGKGVFMANLKSHTVTAMSSVTPVNGWTYSLCSDNNGDLWIGTAQGIFQYKYGSRQLTEIAFDRSNVLMARCIVKDGQSLLVGTSSGLVIYDLKTSESQMLLQDKTIMSIETTPTAIWLSTSQEIICIDKNSLAPHIYTSFGGYFIGEFHGNSHYKSESGTIYFGSDNGIIGFNSSKISRHKDFKRPILLTSLKVNGQSITYNPEEKDNVLDQNILSATKIELASNQNSLEIKFSVPDYSAPNRILYKYMLEGHDQAWHNSQTGGGVYYSMLSPGHYTLHVKAYSENDEQNGIEKDIEVVVAYPWYASWWAWLFYIAIVIGIGHYLYKTYKGRRRQHKLLSMARQNEQLKEAKLRMFTSIAHELRSPLTMVLSPLRQLMSMTPEGTDGDKNQSLYRIMERNCERLLNIVQQITDIRKIDNGQFRLHFSETDFQQYSDNIFQSFAGYATIKRITFTIEHANQHVMIWIDKTHFEKILSNILSNAFKFTPEEGRIMVRTKCILKDAKDWFEIRVYNSGSSISAKDMPHIFERFYQAGNNASSNVGSGIGLNLVTELVTLHHGHISVRNIDPDGVEFIMEFPLGNSHLKEEEILSEEEETTNDNAAVEAMSDPFSDLDEPEPEAGNTEKKKLTVLIVDDDQGLCQYIKDQLQETYNVMTCNGGNPAWQMILTQRPDAVVTDIRMPDGDGIELCKRIKSNPETNNLPIIMLTSENSDRAQINSLNLDVDHFLTKPFNLLMLKSAIAQGIRVRERIIGSIRRTEVGYDYTSTKIDSADDKLFSRINESLKKHLDDSNFGVSELASDAGISRVHLNRKMKERYGISPNAFIRSYRLKQAAYLLVNNNVNVSEVAYRVGFSSHSHFSNTFHEYFGMTPKEFIAYYSENLNDEALQKLFEQ